MIDKPGIYFDMPAAEYFADPCPAASLTQSLCKVLLDRSPAHAVLASPKLTDPIAAEDAEPEKYVAAQAIGNAAHLLLIGRGKQLALGDYDNWRKKESQAFRDDAMLHGRTPILSKHYDRAVEIVDAAREQLEALGWADAFEVGHGETVIAWREGNIWLRSMIDWFPAPTLCYDLKTTAASFAPHVIGRKAEADGWHIQAAFQERGLDAIDPDSAGRRKFRFVALENAPPYALVGVELDEHWMTMGRKMVDRAVAIWRRCMAMGEWPAYPAFPITPEFPGYRETAWLDREQSEPQFAADHLMAG